MGGQMIGTVAGGVIGGIVGGPMGAMAGAAIGGGVGAAVDPIKAPKTPSQSSSNTLGMIPTGDTGKTLDLAAQDTQRTAIKRSKLGTKQLQIPLANASVGGVNTNLTQAKGVNI